VLTVLLIPKQAAWREGTPTRRAKITWLRRRVRREGCHGGAK